MSSIIRAGWLLALGVVPLVTFAADERTCNMRDAALPTNSITYVLCEQGLLLVTNDEGATWAQRKIASKGALRAVAFLDVNRGTTVGDGGAILATEDAGRTWTPRESGTTENLTDIQMVGEEGWIAGYDGVILHTADGGKTWTKQDAGVALSLEALYFPGRPKRLGRRLGGHRSAHRRRRQEVAGGENPGRHLVAEFDHVPGREERLDCRVSPDSYSTPRMAAPPGRPRNSGYSGWLTSIGFDGAKRGWITTDDGFLLSEDGGETWKLQPTDNQLFLNKILRDYRHHLGRSGRSAC